jgi:hypothetical protein
MEALAHLSATLSTKVRRLGTRTNAEADESTASKPQPTISRSATKNKPTTEARRHSAAEPQPKPKTYHGDTEARRKTKKQPQSDTKGEDKGHEGKAKKIFAGKPRFSRLVVRRKHGEKQKTSFDFDGEFWSFKLWQFWHLCNFGNLRFITMQPSHIW